MYQYRHKSRGVVSEAADPGRVKGCTLYLSPQRREPWSYPEVGLLPPGTHDGFTHL